MKLPVSRRGASSDTVPGRKPTVAHLNEDASKSNLELKVKILSCYVSALERGVLREINSEIPLTQRQFHLWTYEDPELGKVTPNGRLTFLKYSDIVLSVNQLLNKISELHRNASGKPSRSDNLAAARRSSGLQKLMRQICEREVVKMRATIKKLNGELETAKAQYSSLERKSVEMLGELEAEIVSLKKSNQELTKQHRKIIGIGVKK
ncbi:hypothetical protein ACIGHN_27530 [Acidovorax sp. NPDC077693]|uniref:hypothetical protein n=1 Tax=unclassified Acidovorax TaxID=2684926 RepID=UPI0037CC8227